MKSTKTLCFAVAAMFVAGGAYSQSMMQKYFDSAASIVPNTMNLSVYEEVKYNDNIHDSRHGTEDDSLIFKTGAAATIYRTKGNVTYGLDADASYNYYTRDSDDLSEFDWNLSPYLQGNFGESFLQGLMITLKSRSVYEPFSKTDTRYVRHYENGIGLAYDYSRHERWGVLTSFEYCNYYYPQSKRNINSTTHNDFDFSLAPYYKVSDKMKTGLHLTHERTYYRDAKKYDDFHKEEITGFVDYRMNMFCSVTAEVGASRVCYEGVSRDSKNDREWEPTSSLTFRYVPTLDWAFAYIVRYKPENGSERGRGQRQSWDNSLRASWQATAKINITNEVTFSMDDEKNCNDDTNELSYNLRVNYAMSDNITVYAGYAYDDVHFKYDGDSDYHTNEVLVGLRWSL